MRLEDMGEWELLERAAKAMFAALCMPAGSAGRCLLWAAHDVYMDELRQRAFRVLATMGALMAAPGERRVTEGRIRAWKGRRAPLRAACRCGR